MRPDFLITLAQDKQMSNLEDRVLRYLNHTLSPFFDKLLWQEAVALFKTLEKLPTQLRPIGMRKPLHW